MLTYKGYHASVEFSADEGLLVGRVLDLRDTIIFEVENASEAAAAFHTAVDDYLAFCAERGAMPEKPYSGRFNVRLAPDLHRKAAVLVQSLGSSLNDFVVQAIEHEVERRGKELA